MNLTLGSISNKERMLSLPNKATALNPNAAEFVPSSLRSTTNGNSKSSITDSIIAPGASKDSTTQEQESTLSNNSDDEAHQYWQHQLPDDITPDFKVMGEDELHGPENPSLADLSINDATDAFFRTSAVIPDLKERIGYSNSAPAEAQSSTAIMTLSPAFWGKTFVNSGQYDSSTREAFHYNRNSSTGLVHDLIGRSLPAEDASINPMKLLSLSFPGLPSKSLADAYYGCGRDLKSTVATLHHLQNQVDGGFSQNLKSKSFAQPNLITQDYIHKSPTVLRGAADSISSPQWRSTRDGSLFAAAGSSRGSQVPASAYNSSNKLHNVIGAQAAPALLEPEETADMFFESKDEAHDLTHLSNALLEQARQAYLKGDGALAKELNLKGHLLNQQINAAREKPRDSSYWQRNLPLPEIQGFSHERDPVIDLRGFHLNEAVHVLNSWLGKLRRTARSTGKQLQAVILTGTGSHSRGARPTARLAVAVEQYLSEHGVRYAQPQPGLLRVVIY